MKNKIDIDTVAKHVCDVFGITTDELKGLSRKQEFVLAREIFSTFCKLFCDAGCVQISKYLNRHYTSIVNSLSKYGDDYSQNKSFRQKADQIANDIVKIYEAQKHSNT